MQTETLAPQQEQIKSQTQGETSPVALRPWNTPTLMCIAAPNTNTNHKLDLFRETTATIGKGGLAYGPS